MKFSSGVYAQVTFKDNLSVSYHLLKSRDVYDVLVDRVGHNAAAEAEGWTEMACVGEWYEEDGFEIEMMEA